VSVYFTLEVANFDLKQKRFQMKIRVRGIDSARSVSLGSAVLALALTNPSDYLRGIRNGTSRQRSLVQCLLEQKDDGIR